MLSLRCDFEFSIGMRKYFLLLVFLLAISMPSHSRSSISTKEQADSFLESYCIELVKSIEESYIKQKEALEDEDMRTFRENGGWIIAVADVYSKMCK